MAIGVGFIEKGGDDILYNSYAVCMPDGKIHIHRKLHAFEHPNISSGNNFTVFDTPWGCVLVFSFAGTIILLRMRA